MKKIITSLALSLAITPVFAHGGEMVVEDLDAAAHAANLRHNLLDMQGRINQSLGDIIRTEAYANQTLLAYEDIVAEGVEITAIHPANINGAGLQELFERAAIFLRGFDQVNLPDGENGADG